MMRIVLFLAMGGVVGTVSGALGIGGGVLLVPLLMWFGGFDFANATGTSLAVLAMPVGVIGAMRAYQQDRVDLLAALCIAFAFAAGAAFGAEMVNRIPKPMLQLSFGLLMIVIAFRFILAGSSETATTAAGLFAAALAWLGYLGLRALGRRHLAKPDLGEHIREQATKGRGEGDYQI